MSKPKKIPLDAQQLAEAVMMYLSEKGFDIEGGSLHFYDSKHDVKGKHAEIVPIASCEVTRRSTTP